MPLRIATVNANGIRAAFRKGMGDWLEGDGGDVDILAIQEVRAPTEALRELFDDGWHLADDIATTKGRAGVAILSRIPITATRTGIGGPDADSAGRWLEADFEVGGRTLTVVSCYVHSGEVDTPKQDAKWAFLDAMADRCKTLAVERPLAAVVGDFNVGHTTLDIKNWRGNRKNAGFLPRERAYFDRLFGAEDSDVEGADGSHGTGLGWVDVGRRFAGEVDGPYTWWSWRGKAFDNDTGWRIDYEAVTPSLAALARDYQVGRAPAYDRRWSDHAPVTVEYDL